MKINRAHLRVLPYACFVLAAIVGIGLPALAQATATLDDAQIENLEVVE